jgi:hypothetical protein
VARLTQHRQGVLKGAGFKAKSGAGLSRHTHDSPAARQARGSFNHLQQTPVHPHTHQLADGRHQDPAQGLGREGGRAQSCCGDGNSNAGESRTDSVRGTAVQVDAEQASASHAQHAPVDGLDAVGWHKVEAHGDGVLQAAAVAGGAVDCAVGRPGEPVRVPRRHQGHKASSTSAHTAPPGNPPSCAWKSSWRCLSRKETTVLRLLTRDRSSPQPGISVCVCFWAASGPGVVWGCHKQASRACSPMHTYPGR